MESPRLISYVMDHDTGFAPNPFFGKCILSHCKFSAQGSRKNVIELASVGTWVVGTGGSKLNSHEKLIFAMKVSEKLPVRSLFANREFAHRRIAFGYNRGCRQDGQNHGKWMLVSDHFFYLGRRAVSIPPPLRSFSESESLIKRGPGYRSKFSEEFLKKFVAWIERVPEGLSGLPHDLDPATREYLKTVDCGCPSKLLSQHD